LTNTIGQQLIYFTADRLSLDTQIAKSYFKNHDEAL
jgi:hypothetical protein